MTVADQAIIKDFETFLNYISQEQGILLTKSKQVLRNADLMYLNEQMHFKSQGVHKKSQQLAFNLLSIFFHIAKVSELASIKREKSKYLLFPNATKITTFQTWTKTEQYFFLLESFWCYLDWDIAIDTRSFWSVEFYDKIAQRESGKWVSLSNRNLKRAGEIRSPSHTPFAEIFAALGWMGLIWDDKLERRPKSYCFPYKAACITDLGKVMLAKLLEARLDFDWNELDPYYDPKIIRKIIAVRQQQAAEAKAMGIQYPPLFSYDWGTVEIPDEPKEKFIDAFLPLLSTTSPVRSWYPLKRPFVAGQYQFKVALSKDLYRIIALDAHQNLEDLHLAIQAVYHFNNDHLYSFYLSGKYDENNLYVDSRANLDGIPALAVDIGEIGLYEGKAFVYVFDFGDNWEFDITVLNISEASKSLQGFELLASVGESPEQYPSYEEDE